MGGESQCATYRDFLQRADVLTCEDKSCGSLLTVDGSSVGRSGLLRVSGADDVHVGEDTEAGHSLYRLVGRSILLESKRFGRA